MIGPVFGICILNIALCGWRFYIALRSGSLLATVWVLMLYFAFCFIPVSLTEEIAWTRGFFGEKVVAESTAISQTMIYVFCFNLIFAVTEMALRRLLPPPRHRFSWRLPQRSARLNTLLLILGVFWLIGSLWYFWHSRTQGYRDYVEGADWSIVFFWASCPIIVLAAMQRRFLLATLFCLPFLYFALHLAVRSFALLSLIPLLLVGMYQAISDTRLRNRFSRLARYVVVAAILLSAISVTIMRDKNGEIALPDSRMPFGTVQAMHMADRFDEQVGFNSLTLYGAHYVNPFMRLFSVPQPDVEDTPVIIARLLDGVPIGWPVYFHYPTLLWADAYLAFGWQGLWLAVFWACVLFCWDSVMLRYPMLLVLLLPYFVWHNYMLVRGAVAVASTPISYALYFSLFAFIAAMRMNLLAKPQRSRSSATATSGVRANS